MSVECTRYQCLKSPGILRASLVCAANSVPTAANDTTSIDCPNNRIRFIEPSSPAFSPALRGFDHGPDRGSIGRWCRLIPTYRRYVRPIDPASAHAYLGHMAFTVNVNGIPQTVDVDADTPLLWVLRDVLGISGTKFGCGIALCGACTVHVDGVPVRSCVTPVSTVGEKVVTTIEAVGETPIGKALQQAWLELDVVQCGYCQSGQIMSAAALLARTPKPTDDDIDQTMSGNVCRCGTYQRVRAAIHLAAK